MRRKRTTRPVATRTSMRTTVGDLSLPHFASGARTLPEETVRTFSGSHHSPDRRKRAGLLKPDATEGRLAVGSGKRLQRSLTVSNGSTRGVRQAYVKTFEDEGDSECDVRLRRGGRTPKLGTTVKPKPISSSCSVAKTLSPPRSLSAYYNESSFSPATRRPRARLLPRFRYDTSAVAHKMGRTWVGVELSEVNETRSSVLALRRLSWARTKAVLPKSTSGRAAADFSCQSRPIDDRGARWHHRAC